MPAQLLPWAPEYGTALRMEIDAPAPPGAVETRVERDTWAPITPPSRGTLHVQIVDGVRRTEAHALDDRLGGSEPAFGLFASLAVGVVTCEAGGARIRDEDAVVKRRYFHTGDGSAPTHEVGAGGTRLVFGAHAVPTATSADHLMEAMNRAMLDAEAALAEQVAATGVLTIVDGPLRRVRAAGHRVVGSIKRVQQWYVGAEERDLLPTLAAGERTPIFLITPPTTTDGAGDGAGYDEGRYSWFARAAVMRAPIHPLGGILRFECSAAGGIEEARSLADEVTAALPRLAGSPVRDPRAPQNLTPIGALEARLTHLLGDRRLIYRLLAAHLAREAQ